MAKEFKQWDKMFSRQEIFDCRAKWLHSGSTLGDIASYTKWPENVAQWKQEFVQYCVYQLESSKEWQCFRVSMKGLTTQEKLYMLHNRYAELVYSRASEDPTGYEWVYYKIEKCRIDNYLGALIRGGQLNSSYEVMK